MTYISTDPIADMFARLRNAIAVRKNEIVLPHSRAKESIANVLKANRYINSVDIIDASIGKSLKLTINSELENARINEIKRLSSPGRRVYSSSKEIPTIKRGRGLIIISTSKGIMTGSEAKKQGVGGELIASIY